MHYYIRQSPLRGIVCEAMDYGRMVVVKHVKSVRIVLRARVMEQKMTMEA